MPTTTSRRSAPIVATAAVAMLGALATVPSAQAPVHLNRLIEALAQGRGELINAVFTRM